MTTITTIREFLEQQVRTFSAMKNVAQFHGYTGLGDFMLKNGREFDTANGIAEKHGPVKECFSNAQKIALFSKRLIYCEGFAVGIIPVMHGWVVRTADSAVIETTWPELGTQYFGIAFHPEYLRRRVLETECYHSLIDDWENDWPLQATERKEWIHPRHDP